MFLWTLMKFSNIWEMKIESLKTIYRQCWIDSDCERKSWNCPTAQKMKFSIKDFIIKCDQIRNGDWPTPLSPYPHPVPPPPLFWSFCYNFWLSHSISQKSLDFSWNLYGMNIPEKNILILQRFIVLGSIFQQVVASKTCPILNFLKYTCITCRWNHIEHNFFYQNNIITRKLISFTHPALKMMISAEKQWCNHKKLCRMVDK